MKYDNRPIRLIRRDGGTQARTGNNESTVTEYLEAMRAGLWTWTAANAVTVFDDGAALWLADGFHRIEAAQRAGHTEIYCQIKRGTQRDAQLHAAGANADHGLRRTRDDVQRAIGTLLRDEEWRAWSNRQIAQHVRCDPKTVAAVRERMESGGEIPHLTERTGADGKSYPTARPAEPARPARTGDPDAPDPSMETYGWIAEALMAHEHILLRISGPEGVFYTISTRMATGMARLDWRGVLGALKEMETDNPRALRAVLANPHSEEIRREILWNLRSEGQRTQWRPIRAACLRIHINAQDTNPYVRQSAREQIDAISDATLRDMLRARYFPTTDAPNPAPADAYEALRVEMQRAGMAFDWHADKGTFVLWDGKGNMPRNYAHMPNWHQAYLAARRLLDALPVEAAHAQDADAPLSETELHNLKSLGWNPVGGGLNDTGAYVTCAAMDGTKHEGTRSQWREVLAGGDPPPARPAPLSTGDAMFAAGVALAERALQTAPPPLDIDKEELRAAAVHTAEEIFARLTAPQQRALAAVFWTQTGANQTWRDVEQRESLIDEGINLLAAELVYLIEYDDTPDPGLMALLMPPFEEPGDAPAPIVIDLPDAPEGSLFALSREELQAVADSVTIMVDPETEPFTFDEIRAYAASILLETPGDPSHPLIIAQLEERLADLIEEDGIDDTAFERLTADLDTLAERAAAARQVAA